MRNSYLQEESLTKIDHSFRDKVTWPTSWTELKLIHGSSVPICTFMHECCKTTHSQGPDTSELLGLQMCTDRSVGLELASPWTQYCADSLLALISKQTLLCVLQCHLQQLELLRHLAGLVQDMVAWKVILSDHGWL